MRSCLPLQTPTSLSHASLVVLHVPASFASPKQSYRFCPVACIFARSLIDAGKPCVNLARQILCESCTGPVVCVFCIFCCPVFCFYCLLCLFSLCVVLRVCPEGQDPQPGGDVRQTPSTHDGPQGDGFSKRGFAATSGSDC